MISGGVPEQGHQHSHAAAKGRVDTYDLCWCWRSFWCPWSGLPWEAMLVSLVCAAAGGHVGVHDLGCHGRPCWYLWFVPLLNIMLGPWWVLPLETMLKPMFVAATRACGCPCYCLIPCGSPWSTLLLAVMSKEASFAVVCIWLQICNWDERPWRLLWQPCHPTHPKWRVRIQRESNWRESLKVVRKMQCVVLHSWWLLGCVCVWWGTQLSLRGWLLEFDHFNEYMCINNWTFCIWGRG